MDRSFLAVRHLLGRLIPSNDNSRQETDASPKKAKRRRDAHSETEKQEGWTRIEF